MKPPPVAQAQISFPMKHNKSSSSVSSSSLHSGTQAFEFLLSDDGSYHHMKPPAATHFTEDQAEHHSSAHIS